MSADPQPADPLPVTAEPAWRAYCAMLASKDAHFSFLAELSHKHQTGGQRTLASAARLQQLLAEHDQCVGAFKHALRALAATDQTAHAALLTALTRANVDVGGPRGALN